MIIAACFLAAIALKNALSYACGLLSRSLNAAMSHRLRSGILTQVLSLSQLYLDAQESGKLINTFGERIPQTEVSVASARPMTLIGYLLHALVLAREALALVSFP